MEKVAGWFRLYGMEYAGYATWLLVALAASRSLGGSFKKVLRRPVVIEGEPTLEEQVSAYLFVGRWVVGIVAGGLGYVLWQAGAFR